MTERPIPPEEAAWVAAAAAGDRAAYDRLVQDLRPLMASVARRYVRGEADVDDVIQQTLLRGWQQIGRFQGRASFRTWILRIATCTALNFIRDQRSFEPVELDELPAFTSALNTARLAAGQLWERVQRSLVDLPDKQRLVVELRLFHDLDFEEIAALADTTPGSARVLFHQGLKAIRAHVGAAL